MMEVNIVCKLRAIRYLRLAVSSISSYALKASQRVSYLKGYEDVYPLVIPNSTLPDLVVSQEISLLPS